MATAVDARVAVPEGGAPSTRRLEAMVTLLSCLGLLIQVVGYAVGWHGDEATAIGLWYVGFVGIVVPFAWLLLAPSRTGHQRLGAALAFGLIMYASWYLTDPIMATRFDETLHVTTLVDMVDQHSFFYPNSTLPVSPHYPGLEFATAGVHWLTGLPLIACQVLVVVTARSTFILALFLLASRIGRSTQVGAATVLLYAGSAQFYFFNSQFSYQTVAIAMLMAALYLLVRAFDSEEERPWRLLIAVQVCLGGLAITHHLTSWLMLALLWLLTLFFWRGGEERRARLTLITAELATVVVLAWTAIIAPLLISYLGPIFDVASSQLLSALDGSSSGRSPGEAGDGTKTPTWELMVMAGSILLWMAMLVPAAWRAWRRGSLGPTRARYIPLAFAVIYPGLQLARFAPSAAEVADRASTFVTLAMALVVAAWLAPRIQTFAALVAPALVLLILGGTLIGGGPDWQRVPGPYLAGAEQRSIDSESVAVAQWAGTYLPKDARVAADSTFIRLLPNFAPVTPITQPAGFDSMTPLFIAHSVDQEVLRLILQNDVDFIVVDTRLVGQTVRSGGFFEGSTGYGPDAQTIKPGPGPEVRGPARLRPRPRRPGQGLRRTPAAACRADLRGPRAARAAGRLDAVAGARDRDAAAGRAARARPAAGPAPLPCPRRVAAGRDPARGDGPRSRWRAGRVQPARRSDRRVRAVARADPAQLAARADRSRPGQQLGVGRPDRARRGGHHRPGGVGGLARAARPRGAAASRGRG